MNSRSQNDSLIPVTGSQSSLAQVSQQNSLVQGATQMINDAAQPMNLFGLLASRSDKERQKKLKSSVLKESARLLDSQLEKTREILKLRTAIAEQSYIDQLRIEHRHTSGEMSRMAENDLRESIIGLYSSKVSQLESLGKLDADEELKAIGAEVIAQMTEASAEQLVRHNTKPR